MITAKELKVISDGQSTTSINRNKFIDHVVEARLNSIEGSITSFAGMGGKTLLIAEYVEVEIQEPIQTALEEAGFKVRFINNLIEICWRDTTDE